MTNLLANGELGNTLIPTLDDAADTDLGLEGVLTVTGRVELGAVQESSNVLHVSLAYTSEWTNSGW
jgi:hypothetical protein